MSPFRNGRRRRPHKSEGDGSSPRKDQGGGGSSGGRGQESSGQNPQGGGGGSSGGGRRRRRPKGAAQGGSGQDAQGNRKHRGGAKGGQGQGGQGSGANGAGKGRKRKGRSSRRRSDSRNGQGETPRPEDLTPAEGILQVMSEGFGFLRSAKYSYLPTEEDVFVPQNLIRRHSLRVGSEIVGEAAPSRKLGRSQSLFNVKTVNGVTPDEASQNRPFKLLTSIDPFPKFCLDTDVPDTCLRVIDLIAPIGKGQRGLIVAPPRTGKTILLQKIANAITRNHPEVHLMMVLIDERPEEVTDMRRSIKGEVISSSSDEAARGHVRVAEMVLERARRLVEAKKDVVIFLDSLTRLGRAYNLEIGNSGRTLSGGLDARTMEKPREFFGSARNAEEGGSLTIVATALIETGSRMDQVIFEEFKGTGNMELVLSRALADRRIFPAIDLNPSGTRKEEKMREPNELKAVWMLRRVLNQLKPLEGMELLIDKLEKTPSNAEFLGRFVAKANIT